MPRILWVFNQFASTPETNTGAGERHYYLGQFLFKNHWETTVFSAAYNHLFLKQPDKKFPYRSVKYVNGSTFVWIWVNRYNPSSGLQRLVNWLAYCFSLAFSVKKKFGKPDVILVSSMSMWPTLNALIYKFFHPKVAFVFEVRDVWPLTPVYLGNLSRSNPIVQIMFWIEKLAVKKSDAIISVLPNYKKRVNEVAPGNEAKVHWIPNAISSDLKFKSTPKTNPSHVTIIYAGAMGTANALQPFVKAAVSLSDKHIQFHLFGDGPMKDELMSIAGGHSNIRFFGKIPKEDLQEHIYAADLCFIAWHDSPLYEYGVSANKYNDYMMAQKPILSAGTVASDPVQVANAGISIEANDAESIEKAIIQIVSMSPTHRAELGQNGYRYLMNNQTYDAIGMKYLEILNQVSTI